MQGQRISFWVSTVNTMLGQTVCSHPGPNISPLLAPKRNDRKACVRDSSNEPACTEDFISVIVGAKRVREPLGDYSIFSSAMLGFSSCLIYTNDLFANTDRIQSSRKMMQTSWRFQISANESGLPGMFSERRWSTGTDSQLLADSHTAAAVARRESKVALRQLPRTLL